MAQSNAVSRAAAVALAATALCLLYLFLCTHFLYRGDWSSVFYTGARGPVPDKVAGETVYRFPNVVGYDGQLYHMIAHDPLIKGDTPKYFDQPRIRYRRILVPGLAALLSFGHTSWVDPAYITVVLSFVFLGVFWTCRWCITQGFSVFWGLLFLAMPATIVGTFYMVVDTALASLAAGFIWYAAQDKKGRLFLVMAAAALCRETGILFIGGYCLWLLFERRLLPAIGFGLSILPAFFWALYVQAHTTSLSPEWFSPIPFLGIWRGITGHWTYSQAFLLWLDFVAMAGMLLAFAIAAYYISRRALWNSATFMAAGFLVLGVFLSNPDIWPEVNAYGRYYTPILLFIAATGIPRGHWWTLIPVALVDARILVVFGYRAVQILQAMRHA